MLNKLKEYQAWRRGEDKRPLADTDLTPEVIGQAIDWAIAELENRPSVAPESNAVPPPFAEALVRANLPEQCADKAGAAA